MFCTHVRVGTHVLPSSLLVVHDARRGGEDDLSEGSSGEQQVDPVLDGIDTDVESGRDDTGLVESTVQLDDDLAASVVVDDLELADVACCQCCSRRMFTTRPWHRTTKGSK